jgi:hypothetical protein
VGTVDGGMCLGCEGLWCHRCGAVFLLCLGLLGYLVAVKGYIHVPIDSSPQHNPTPHSMGSFLLSANIGRRDLAGFLLFGRRMVFFLGGCGFQMVLCGGD